MPKKVDNNSFIAYIGNTGEGSSKKKKTKFLRIFAYKM